MPGSPSQEEWEGEHLSTPTDSRAQAARTRDTRAARNAISSSTLAPLPHEQSPQYDYAQLLQQLEKSKPLIPRPMQGRESSVGNALAWGKLLGEQVVLQPVSRLLDLFDNGDQPNQPEYMSWSKKQLYR